MEYTIHSRNNTQHDDMGGTTPAYFGVEIQPPLDPLAIQGVIDALTVSPTAHADAPGGQEPAVAASARVVRQDKAGTALWIRSNNNALSTPAEFAEHIGQLIDPCNVHNITYNHGVQAELGSPGAIYEASRPNPR